MVFLRRETIRQVRARLRPLFDRPAKRRAALAVALAAVMTGVETSTAEAAAAVEVVAEKVVETVEARVENKVASNRGNESHLGFDTNVYPGDRTMRRWKDAEHYTWVGYYLPAPCHKDPSWSGKRQTLEEMGWGIAVVYVGQQAWGAMAPGHFAAPARPARKATRRAPARKAPAKRQPARKRSTKKRAAIGVGLPVVDLAALEAVIAQIRPAALPQPRHEWRCDRSLVNGAQGRREGQDAIERTAIEGFPRGSVIFLDIERMEKVPQAMRDYYREWTRVVLEDGRYRPGYYAHNHNAKLIYEDVKPLFTAAGVSDEPRFWIASGRNFHKGKAPTDVGHAFASMWQGVLDVVEVWNDIELPIDINVSDRANPSAAD